MEVVVLVGLQGSGKSTFYRSKFASTHTLVSKDRFPNNRRPARRQAQLIEEALSEGRSVVVDNTNPTVEDRAAIVSITRAFGARLTAYYFSAPIQDCLVRNRQRTEKSLVPDAAIFITQKRLQPPTLAEGFDQIWQVNVDLNGSVSLEERIETGAS